MSKFINPIAAGVFLFCIGFIAGAGMMLSSWSDAAQRGIFEVGHKVYRAQQVQP